MPSAAALAAVAHRDLIGTKHVDVPQWLVDGKPLRIHWKPMTVAEADKFAEYRGQPGGDVYILIEKALDANGNKVFTLEDKQMLMYDAVWNVVSGLALLICAMPSMDQIEKK